MMVDDEPDICVTLKEVLEGNGFKVTTFIDPIMALENFKSSLYDLLILDIMIPGVDGIEVCRRIKNDSNNRTIIIAVSGSAERENDIIRAGADAFMVKPLDLERLQSEARRLLRVL